MEMSLLSFHPLAVHGYTATLTSRFDFQHWFPVSVL